MTATLDSSGFSKRSIHGQRSCWPVRLWCALLLLIAGYFGATAPEVQQWLTLADATEPATADVAASTEADSVANDRSELQRSAVATASNRGAVIHPASAGTDALEGHDPTAHSDGDPHHSTMAIADLQIGMRVLGRNPEVSDAARSAFARIDPSTSRIYHLRMDKGSGTTVDIDLLRPESWLTHAFNARSDLDGNGVFINLPEMGVVGDAELLGVRPCPPLDASATSDAGTITGRFIHTASEILAITFDGSDTPIGVTPNHPFWDPIAQEFKQIGAFAIGDQVLGRQGLATLTNIERRAGPVTVYNIETHGEHVYRVAAAGLLVHNAYNKLKDQGIYVLVDKSNNVHYAGRGDVTARRVAHRAAHPNLNQVVLIPDGLTPDQAKGLEQALIDQFGGARSQGGSRLLNKIRSYRIGHPRQQVRDQMRASNLHRDNLDIIRRRGLK